jgi:hypothetical protein
MIRKQTTDKTKRAWESDLVYLDLIYKTLKKVAMIIAVVYFIRVLILLKPEAALLVSELISLLK